MKITEVQMHYIHELGYLSWQAQSGRSVKGFKVDLRTKFDSSRDRREIIAQLKQFFRSRNNSSKIPRLHPVLLDLEERESEKIGPYSIRLPLQERLPSIFESYRFQDRKLNLNLKAYNLAFNRVRSLFQKGILVPLSSQEAYDRLPKSTNWGSPYFKSGTEFGSVYLKDFENLYFSNKSKLIEYPSVLGWRGQPTSLQELPKQRDVWMYPHFMSILEKKYLDPVIKIARRDLTFSALNGFDGVDYGVTQLFSNLKTTHGKNETLFLLSIDFSKFDKSIKAKFIIDSFSIIKYWYANNKVYSEDLDLICKYFLSGPLLLPNNQVLNGLHGVPSGSGFTNFVDSLVNLLFYYYLVYNNFYLFSEIGFPIVQGDDGIYPFKFNHPYSPTHIHIMLSALQKSAKDFCLDLNVSKQFVSIYSDRVKFSEGQLIKEFECPVLLGELCVHYLQRIHLDSYSVYFKQFDHFRNVGVRSLFRCLNGLLSLEILSSRWNKWMESVRFIMQIENCKYHPFINYFIEWCINKDKLRLGLVFPNILDLFKIAGGVQHILATLKIEAFPIKYYGLDTESKLTLYTVQYLESVRSGKSIVVLPSDFTSLSY